MMRNRKLYEASKGVLDHDAYFRALAEEALAWCNGGMLRDEKAE
jgi:hypothetical protein